jgi:hypothetical protein
MEYEHKTYSTGWSVKVTPEDRTVDVLHYLTTGGLLGGRSLDGVTWEDAGEDYGELRKRNAKFLAASMRQTKEIMKQNLRNMAE